MNYIDTQDLGKYEIVTKNGELGKIKNFYFDEELYYFRYFIVDTNTFLSRNLVLVSPISFKKIDIKHKKLELDLTKKELEDSPSLDSVDTVSRQYEKAYNDHFSWPYYWASDASTTVQSTVGAVWKYSDQLKSISKSLESKKDMVKKAESNHIRSANEVSTYSIKGIDNEFGNIRGYILNMTTLSIEFIVVNTINFIPSKHVLLRPQYIKEISWDLKVVEIPFTKATIKSAPAYDGNITEKAIEDSDKYFRSISEEIEKDTDLYNEKTYVIHDKRVDSKGAIRPGRFAVTRNDEIESTAL